MIKSQIISGVVRELIDNKLFNLFPLNLKGACAITSYVLFLSLKRNGYRPKFVIGRYLGMDHCWIECNQSIIDLTATQFNLFDKVNVFKTNDIRYFAIKKSLNKKDFVGWKPYQNPFNYSIKWNNKLPLHIKYTKK